MPSSHVYADGSAGFFRVRISDGSHSHVQRIHVNTATVDNATDPGSPTDQTNLINPEGEVNRTARNWMAMITGQVIIGYSITLLDFQAISGGAPSGPPIPLQPYTLAGRNTAASLPEAQKTFTFRDTEGAPVRFTFFGGNDTWVPNAKPNLVANWAGTGDQVLAAYLLGIAKSGAPSYPAGMSGVRSHHGFPPAVPLAIVSGLNRRLRRAYRVE